MIYIIFECEFVALFAAFWKWTDEIKGSLVTFADNNAVRDSMISCSTKNQVATTILVATLAVENRQQLWPWYSRVPTDANAANAPSRFDMSKLCGLGVQQSALNVGHCWSLAKVLAKQWGEHQASTNSQ